MLSHFSPVWHFSTPWTIAHQAPLSMGYSRQECWSGLPCPPPGGLPNSGIQPGTPALQADSLPCEPLGNCLQCRTPGLDPRVRKVSWRREWLPTPVILPGEFHGWRNLAGYSPWGRKESDTTERLHFLSLSLSVVTNEITYKNNLFIIVCYVHSKAPFVFKKK